MKIKFVFWLPLAFFMNVLQSEASDAQWLYKVGKEYWRTSSKTEKSSAIGGATLDAYDRAGDAAKSVGAFDLFNKRRNDPVSIPPKGSLQKAQKPMANAACSVLRYTSYCYLVDGTTKLGAAQGELASDQNRIAAASTSQKTEGQRQEDLLNELKGLDQRRLDIAREARTPLEDRDLPILRAMGGLASQGTDAARRSMKSALEAFALSVDEKLPHNEDGAACGDMLWYMGLGDRCREPEVVGEGEVGMRLVGREECSPLPRDFEGFLKIQLDGGNGMFGCQVAETVRDERESLRMEMSCPNGERGQILYMRRPQNQQLRLIYLRESEAHTYDYEACNIDVVEKTEKCTASASSKRKPFNPLSMIQDCGNQ